MLAFLSKPIWYGSKKMVLCPSTYMKKYCRVMKKFGC